MSLKESLLDILFPPRCAFCRRLLRRGESGMCGRCAASLPYTPEGYNDGTDFVEACVAPLFYEGAVRDALLRYKFSGVTAYAGIFGRLVAGCVRERLAGRYDLISWVPLSSQRLSERGYDQAMLIAMAAALELGDVAVETLRKRRDAAPQSVTGSIEKRRANISGAYEVIDPELVEGRRILLIDDIVTTGATAAECARTLGGAGAAKVVCAALAKAE